MNILKIWNRLTERASEVSPLTRNAAMWDAAGGGNRLANWNVQPTAINAWIENPILVRARADGEYRNNPWAKKITDAIVQAAIGAPGINPMFKDRAVSDAWASWCDTCDASGRLDWIAISHLILQTVIVSGECFVKFGFNADAAVPLTLQLLGPEFLDTSRVDKDTFSGIQYSGVRRVGYWLYERHPSLIMTPLRSVFVPVSEVLHIFKPSSPGAERGVSWLAPVLLALRELQEYTEAALVRQKVGSLYCGYVQTADGSNPLNATNAVPTLEPGSIVRLQPGEVVDFSAPPDVGLTFDPFVRAQLRKISAGVNLPYEIVSGDQGAVTFASGRHGLLEWKRHSEAIQHVLLVPQFCGPVLARWMQLALALGVIGQPSKARWIGPQLAMLDSRYETKATVEQIRAGLLSRQEAVSATGWSIEEIDAEQAADNARADALGLVLDSDPRKTTVQGQEQVSASQTQ